MRSLCAFLFVLVSCKDAQSPSATPEVGTDAICGIADRTVATCSTGLKCTQDSYTPPPAPEGGVRGPDKPSPVGGACGGVAGFHCAEGLVCDMPKDQEMVADGMGSCARASKCR